MSRRGADDPWTPWGDFQVLRAVVRDAGSRIRRHRRHIDLDTAVDILRVEAGQAGLRLPDHLVRDLAQWHHSGPLGRWRMMRSKRRPRRPRR
ncbi:hypothetical protein [Nocardioides sp.]|uniref:hypothetical protein n=1 Tax=Nocardioides sp. TaxID=35761 RepID=UPI003511F6C5